MKKNSFTAMMRYRGRRLLLLASVVCLFAASGISRAESEDESIVETVVEATCTEDGYKAIRNNLKHTTYIEQIPAAGHQFGEWIPDKDQATETRQCSVCGYTETIRTDSIPMDTLAKLYLTGTMEGIGKKQKVTLEAEFFSDEVSFRCYAIMSVQGHSTLGMPKRNYTVRFYDDPNEEKKHKVVFGDWRKEHKFILKSNYMDLTQSRNLTASLIWEDMVSCRENVSPRILETPTLGAVEGFPVIVYLNGEFFGLYTLNLHKDDDLYRMKKESQEALVICNRHSAEESSFRAEAAFTEDYSSDWEIEFCGTEDETWAKESFNELIRFVMDATDEEFRATLSQRLDVDSAIDYLIFIYTLGLSHSGTKDLVMLSYRDKWIVTAFDMDEAFGLDAQAYRYLDPEAFLPVKTNGIWDSGTDSRLWDRLLQNFEEEIRQRYTLLRQGILNEDEIIRKIDGFIGQISVSLYDMDYLKYPDRPMDDQNMADQMKQYIRNRLAVLDRILGGIEE